MPVLVLYGVLSLLNRTSRWMRNSEPPDLRGSAAKWGEISSNRPAKSVMNSSAGSRTERSYRSLLASNHSLLLLSASSRKKANRSLVK